MVNMRKSFKYKATLSKTTAQKASWQLARCCELYNAALEERIAAYKAVKKTISFYDQCYALPGIKEVRPEYKQIGSQVLTDVLNRLHKAYQAFFRRVKEGGATGFPKFQSSKRYDSITFSQCGWKLGDRSESGKKRSLTLTGIGTMRLFWHRSIEGKVKTVTLKRDSSGDWWVIFSCDDVPDRVLPSTDLAVGIDVGIESFLTTSDGQRVSNPRPYHNGSVRLSKANRLVSKRKKGGSRRRKAAMLLAKQYRRVSNIRRDFHFKEANTLVKQYDLIAVEKLNVKGLQQGMLSKSVSDVGWGRFFEILSFKAKETGKLIMAVAPQGTSQMCSECQTIPDQKKKLSERLHKCLKCGYTSHRDFNAARNILRLGIEMNKTGRVVQSASIPATKAGVMT